MTILTISLPPERNSKDNHNIQEVWEERTFREISILMNRMNRQNSKLKMREKSQTVIWRSQMMIMSDILIKDIIPPWATQLQWVIRARRQ